MVNGQLCALEVQDIAGQEEYTTLRDLWIQDGEGFILIYCITKRSSSIRIQRFYNQITMVKEMSQYGSLAPSDPPFYPVMLVGNNCHPEIERKVSTQKGYALAKKIGCDFVEASPSTVPMWEGHFMTK
jgi:GTPase KRas